MTDIMRERFECEIAEAERAVRDYVPYDAELIRMNIMTAVNKRRRRKRLITISAAAAAAGIMAAASVRVITTDNGAGDYNMADVNPTQVPTSSPESVLAETTAQPESSAEANPEPTSDPVIVPTSAPATNAPQTTSANKQQPTKVPESPITQRTTADMVNPPIDSGTDTQYPNRVAEIPTEANTEDITSEDIISEDIISEGIISENTLAEPESEAMIDTAQAFGLEAQFEIHQIHASGSNATTGVTSSSSSSPSSSGGGGTAVYMTVQKYEEYLGMSIFTDLYVPDGLTTSNPDGGTVTRRGDEYSSFTQSYTDANGSRILTVTATKDTDYMNYVFSEYDSGGVTAIYDGEKYRAKIKFDSFCVIITYRADNEAEFRKIVESVM